MWPAATLRAAPLVCSGPDCGDTDKDSLSSHGRSTFAVDGKDCKVNKEVERVLKEFHGAKKPIG